LIWYAHVDTIAKTEGRRQKAEDPSSLTLRRAGGRRNTENGDA
jgi:hypothetical protein